MSALQIRSQSPMGRYALNIHWTDGHESILPLRSLRAHCPCEACAAIRAEEEQPPGSPEIALLSSEEIGEDNIYLNWSDGHETWYLLRELRSLCRCAFCVGEPERPITG
ncbi:MAG: gamma-butyrobetaine hydroxylase-like domain-containing protein [Deltaproteobacteria bacterium]